MSKAIIFDFPPFAGILTKEEGETVFALVEETRGPNRKGWGEQAFDRSEVTIIPTTARN
jgi:hypothetical protein